MIGALVAVGVVAVVVKRLRGEPMNLRDLVAPPVIFVGIGVWSLWHAERLTGVDLFWVIAGALLGAALGAVRGTTVRIFVRDEVLWQRYTGWTFLVILGTLVVMAGFGFLSVAMGMHEGARPVQLSIGVGFLGESLVLALRGRATGVPFAPETRPRF
ncbi:Protein of unknown function [Streptoalloteichus hindustanus]|uniref:DUF1453 domain-containing protein n=1 Tax=Streptoalloteichus hindustanus TaxID=2017 RepID=A0A1M5FMI5_STRHI|nr:Protein of unknown function [Streptoalloteichus hindustanus]